VPWQEYSVISPGHKNSDSGLRSRLPHSQEGVLWLH
jgi:hypothetical protein